MSTEGRASWLGRAKASIAGGHGVANGWYQFDSLTMNPPLDLGARRDGTVSGMLPVRTGDRLSIECEVDNARSSPLSFGSDLRAQEICVLYLSAVGVSINPSAD